MAGYSTNDHCMHIWRTSPGRCQAVRDRHPHHLSSSLHCPDPSYSPSPEPPPVAMPASNDCGHQAANDDTDDSHRAFTTPATGWSLSTGHHHRVDGRNKMVDQVLCFTLGIRRGCYSCCGASSTGRCFGC